MSRLLMRACDTLRPIVARFRIQKCCSDHIMIAVLLMGFILIFARPGYAMPNSDFDALEKLLFGVVDGPFSTLVCMVFVFMAGLNVFRGRFLAGFVNMVSGIAMLALPTVLHGLDATSTSTAEKNQVPGGIVIIVAALFSLGVFIIFIWRRIASANRYDLSPATAALDVAADFDQVSRQGGDISSAEVLQALQSVSASPQAPATQSTGPIVIPLECMGADRKITFDDVSSELQESGKKISQEQRKLRFD
jgi:type IV secretory pathway VirB2 component (pilin)